MNSKKWTGFFTACVMVLFLTVAPTALADGVTGGTVNLKITLLMDQQAAVPDVTFSYTLASGDPVPSSGTELPIQSGPSGAALQGGGSVTFSSGDATAETGNKKAAEKTLTVDFSGVTFPDTGVYRYVVTAAPSTVAGVETDADSRRYIDIAVENNDSGALQIASTVVRRASDSAKSEGFTNYCSTDALTVAKQVTGNQASKRKYFQFTVTVLPDSTSATEIPDDTRFGVTGSFDRSVAKTAATVYETDAMNAANADELSVDGGNSYVTYAQLKNGKVFYLRHGQNVVISDIPEGYGYSVTEVPEDYTVNAVQVAGDQTGYTRSGALVTDDTLTAYTTLTYTNSRSAPVPTGVGVAIVVPALLVLGGLMGVGTIVVRRNKRS